MRWTWKDIDSALAELEDKEGLPDFDSLADEIGKALRNVIPHQPKNVRRMWERRLADARRDHQRELKAIQTKSNELAMSISNNAESASNMDINDLILDAPADFGVSQDDFRQKLVQDVVSALSGKGNATSATNLVVCPICGRKNDPKDTFRCRECERDDICVKHQDEKTFLCSECVAKTNYPVQCSGKPTAIGDVGTLSEIRQASHIAKAELAPWGVVGNNYSVFISGVPQYAVQRVIGLLREEYGFTYHDAEKVVKNGGIAKNGLTKSVAEEMAHDLRNKGAKAESMTYAEGKACKEALHKTKEENSNKPVAHQENAGGEAPCWGSISGVVTRIPGTVRKIEVGPVSFNLRWIPPNGARKGFWLGETQVTQGLWGAVLGRTSNLFPGNTRPVDSVDFEECIAFLDKLNGLAAVRAEGLKFRLPTCEEWDFACLAGGNGRYGLLGGGREGTPDEMAWHVGNSGSQTHPVGLKAPNAWGLFDMHGNVWERVLSEDGASHFLKGGSYYYAAQMAEVGRRRLVDSGYSCELAVGLRLAADSTDKVQARGTPKTDGSQHREIERGERDSLPRWGGCVPQGTSGRNYSAFISEVPEYAARRVIALLREEYGLTYQDAEKVVKNGGIAKSGLTRPTAVEMAHDLRNKGAKAESMTDAEGKAREEALRKTKDGSQNAPLTHERGLGEKAPRRGGVSAAAAQRMLNEKVANSWYARALASKNGVGVPKNVAEAVNCYRKSAQFGNADAQFELACMYGKGDGVPMDAVEMAKLFFNAAVQGHVGAQYMLGWCYENGCGVRLDINEAKNWYQRAAQNGNESAKRDLQRLVSRR